MVRLVAAYLSPLPACLHCCLSWHTTAPDAVTTWGDEGWRVPVGRLGRTVGQGPRRCGLTVWARSKYTAPLKMQEKEA